jgi:DNA primase small subunit
MNDTISFLKQRFSDYYKTTELYLPDRFGKREWGFMFLGEGFMKRHLSFQNVEILRHFLVKNVPAHVYHSSAYYEKPNAPTMSEKNWLGADLIFDLDADHIKGAKKMSYEETLRKVKEEFKRLIDDFLLSDFGFSEEQLTIVFSGGRGYHIHIRDHKVLDLTSHERREIVDYITGKVDMEEIFEEQAFDKKTFGPHTKVIHKVLMPRGDKGGWKRKMSHGILRLTDELEQMGKEEALGRLRQFEGIGLKIAEGIYAQLFDGDKGNRRVDRLRNEKNLEPLGIYLEPFLKIVKGEISVRVEGDDQTHASMENLIVKDKLDGETDEPVTSDIKRLIRLPSSLHGKTGFMVMTLSRDGLDDFEPLRDAVPEMFSDAPIKLEVKTPVKVKLRNEVFDLKEGGAEVPEFAAIFLMCRRNAVLPTR